MARTDERELEIITLRDEERLHLQRIADRVADIKERLAKAEGEEETARDDLWPLFDSFGGARETHLVYESLEPHLGKRLSREISYRRVFDVDGLRLVLSPAAFREITKTVVDVDALDVARDRHRIDEELVARYMSYVPVIKGPLWKTSSRSLRLEPGQLVVVRS